MCGLLKVLVLKAGRDLYIYFLLMVMVEMFRIPWIPYEVPSVLGWDVFGDGHAGVDPLDVPEGLVRVAVDGCLG